MCACVQKKYIFLNSFSLSDLFWHKENTNIVMKTMRKDEENLETRKNRKKKTTKNQFLIFSWLPIYEYTIKETEIPPLMQTEFVKRLNLARFCVLQENKFTAGISFFKIPIYEHTDDDVVDRFSQEMRSKPTPSSLPHLMLLYLLCVLYP